MKAVLIVGLAFVVTAAFAQSSDPVYITDLRPQTLAGKMSPESLKDTHDQADLYAKVSGLSPLREGSADEVRFWVTWATFDASTNGIATVGYIIAGERWQVCEIGYSARSTIPRQGHCKRYRPRATREQMTADLRQLAAFADFSIACGTLDGEWVTIDALSSGKRFNISADNPISCEGDAPELVGRLLNGVRR